MIAPLPILRLAVLACALAAAVAVCAEEAESPKPKRLKLVAEYGDPHMRHEDSITACVRLADGKRVLTASQDGTARLWDWETATELKRYGNFDHDFWSLVLLEGEKEFLTAGDEKVVRRWNLETGACLGVYRGPKEGLFRMAASPDGSRIAAVGRDKTVWVWDAARPDEPLAWEGHTDKIYGVAFSNDGKKLATCSADDSVRIWDNLEPKAVGRILSGHTEDVCSVLWTADDRHVLSCSNDESVRCWNAEDGKEIWKTKLGGDAHVMTILPDGERVAVSSDDKQITCLNLKTGEKSDTLSLERRSWIVQTIHQDIEMLTAYDHSLFRYERANGKRIYPAPDYVGHLGKVSRVVPLPEPGAFLSVEDKKTLRWKPGQAKPEAPWTLPESSYFSALSPDGRQVVMGEYGPTFRIVDLTTGNTTQTTKLEDSGSLKALRWLPTGIVAVNERYVESNDRIPAPAQEGDDAKQQRFLDERLEVWSVTNQQQLSSLQGLYEGFLAVHLSKDGTLVFAVDEAGALLCWNGKTGKLLLNEALGKKKNDRFSLLYIPRDGLLLVGNNQDPHLRAWKRKSHASAPRELEIQAGLANLTSEVFQERENAVKQLAELGAGILPYLPDPDKVEDLELAQRVRAVKALLADGEAPQERLERTLELGTGVESLKLHPDGRHWLAYVNRTGPDELVWGEIGPDGPRELQRLSSPKAQPSRHAWAFSADGRWLYVALQNSSISVYAVE